MDLNITSYLHCYKSIENRDHHPTHPDDLLIKEFNAYLDNVPIYGLEEFRTNLIENTIPRKLRKLFSIFISKDKTRE